MLVKKVFIALIVALPSMVFSFKSFCQITTPAQWEAIRAERERQEARNRQQQKDQQKGINTTTPTKNPGRPVKDEPEPYTLKWTTAEGAYIKDGYTYRGYYQWNSKGNRRHGYGKCEFKNGDEYEGEWQEDKMWGKGTYQRLDWTRYVGTWNAGKFVGPGTFNSEVLGEKDDPTEAELEDLKPYDKSKFKSSGKLTPVRERFLWGFADVSGSIVIPFQYQYALPCLDGRMAVKQNEKWGYLDGEGKIIIPFQYNYANSFHEGLANVTNAKNLYGYINKSGKILIPFQYGIASSFHEGLAMVNNGENKYGYINISGKVVIPFQFGPSLGGFFSEGLAAVTSNNAWGYINKHGKVIIPFLYCGAEEFKGGKAKVSFYKEGSTLLSYAIIDKTGKFISGEDFTSIPGKNTVTGIMAVEKTSVNFTGSLSDIAYSDDSKKIIISSEGVINVYAIKTDGSLQSIDKIENRNVYVGNVAINISGDRIAFSGHSGTKILSLVNGKYTVVQELSSENEKLKDCFIAFDGDRLITANTNLYIKLYKLKNNKYEEVFRVGYDKPREYIQSASLSFDKKTLFTFDTVGELRIWDIEADRIVLKETINPGGDCFSAKAGMIAIARAWGIDIYKNSKATPYTSKISNSNGKKSVSIDPKRDVILCGGSKEIYILKKNIAGEYVTSKVLPFGNGNCDIIRFSPDGKYFAAASKDSYYLKIYSTGILITK